MHIDIYPLKSKLEIRAGKSALTMSYTNAKKAGTIILAGSAQYILCLVIAESIYPHYSISTNFLSDLGVWGNSSAFVFNPSIMLLGLAVIAGSYFLSKDLKIRAIPILLAATGVGYLLVGIFPENTLIWLGKPIIHSIGALLAFSGGGVAAISFYKITKGPYRYITVILGAVILLAAVLFVITSQYNYLGLGVGGMERVNVDPALISLIGFGGYLLGKAKTET